MAIEEKHRAFEDIKRIGKLTNDGVFVYQIETKSFLFVNAALVKIVEINKKLLMEDAHLLLQAIPELDQGYLKTRFSQLLESEKVEDVQFQVSSGKQKKTLSCNAYLSENKTTVVGFVKDVSRLRQHEDYLVNHGARKDVILDMVSQNLSTPLNLSRFTVDLIEKAVNEKKYHKLNAHISLMREVTGDCIRIIDDFLQEEHLESPKIYPRENRFDMMEKMRIILERLKTANPEKNLKMTSRITHLFINADDVKFFQVVHNLLSNSIKFTTAKGTIEIIVNDFKTKVQILIKDNGIGIPENLKPFVFEKKTRAARPGLNGEISNGIGLYTVRELVGLMNGAISLESKENRGTTFTLELPK
jgi:two-component system, OmpR family, sensor histidine kinase VicK